MKSKVKKLLGAIAGTTVLAVTACNGPTPEKAFEACKDAENRYNAVAEKFEKAEKDGVLTDSLRAGFERESEALFEETKQKFADFFSRYIDTPFAQKIFAETRWVRRLNREQLETVINSAKDAVFRETETFKNAADRVKYMKQSTVGNEFINIAAKDTTGNVVELARFVGKGKYVLIDFWASWCPDCRVEMPRLISLYNDLKDSNFEIVGYSLDRKEDAWKKGIIDLGIPWPQMSDLSYWSSPGAQKYAVQWIPQYVLISPEGKIAERGLGIDELATKLKTLLQKEQ
jgi:thiol-disulfide isomerase/thioredoxin